MLAPTPLSAPFPAPMSAPFPTPMSAPFPCPRPCPHPSPCPRLHPSPRPRPHPFPHPFHTRSRTHTRAWTHAPTPRLERARARTHHTRINAHESRTHARTNSRMNTPTHERTHIASRLQFGWGAEGRRSVTSQAESQGGMATSCRIPKRGRGEGTAGGRNEGEMADEGCCVPRRGDDDSVEGRVMMAPSTSIPTNSSA